MGGLPIFASSIGILYRGAPVAGAIYIPWPGAASGRVFHARKGGGAFMDDEPVTPLTAEAGDGRLAALPGSFRGAFNIGKEMQGKVGDVRVLGSIAYELAMVASGVLRYTFIGRTALWDVAAGAAIVAEAGGDVRVGRSTRRTWPLSPELRFDRSPAFVDGLNAGQTTLGELRGWTAPVIAGRPDVVPDLGSAITPRRSLHRRLRHVLRR